MPSASASYASERIPIRHCLLRSFVLVLTHVKKKEQTNERTEKRIIKISFFLFFGVDVSFFRQTEILCRLIFFPLYLVIAEHEMRSRKRISTIGSFVDVLCFGAASLEDNDEYVVAVFAPNSRPFGSRTLFRKLNTKNKN